MLIRNDRLNKLPTVAWERLVQVVHRFEDAYQRGERPAIEAYLSADEADRRALLEVLAHVELEYRLQAGEPARVEDYCARYPELVDDRGALLELLAAEYRLRRQQEPGVTRDEYRRRFPQFADDLDTAFGPDADTPQPPDGRLPPSQPEIQSVRKVGRYEVFGEVARGGMGVILRGRDPELNRELAIKVLHPELQDDPEVVQRFLEEAQVGGQLQHPGIAPIHELGRFADGRPYFTMKLIQGRTLAELLQERKDPLQDLPRFLARFAQVCQTVAYAHSRGVLHRDLKPHNVMVGAFSEVQVMDWGLAKVLSPASRERQRPEEPTSGIRTVRTAAGAAASQEGAVIGTPAYMPPEQARGAAGHVDERADVFGLGAILCEILTGQPPYVGDSVFEIHLQAARGELAGAWARLDVCGADAELVHLAKACLAPGRENRPRDAGAVAERMTAYLAGVQERLLQAELARSQAQVKLVEERKRRRLTVVLALAVLALVVLGGGGAGWYAWQREQACQRAESLLGLAQTLQHQSRWAEAREALAQAVWQLGGGQSSLREKLEQAQADLEWLARLDAIRLRRITIVDGRFDRAGAAADYTALFREAGLSVAEDGPGRVATRIRDSAIREAWVAALGDWFLATEDKELKERLFQAACEADTSGWPNRLQDPTVWDDPLALERLVREAIREPNKGSYEGKIPSSWLIALLESLRARGHDVVPILRTMQLHYPADFWTNVFLGTSLIKSGGDGLDEAISCLRMALVLRQDSAAYSNLGAALEARGRADEAIDAFRQAVALNSKSARAHYNLGNGLMHGGRLDEAAAAYRQAIALDPEYARAHSNLSIVLKAQGRLDEAIAAGRQAVALEPEYARIHSNFGAVLYAAGRLDEALAVLRQAVALDPTDDNAYNNLGLALKAQGRLDEAIDALRQAITLAPNAAKAYTDLGAALKVRGRLDEAIKMHRQAVALAPRDAMTHNGLGSTLHARGELDEAVSALRQAVALDPNSAVAHNNLGLVLLTLGLRGRVPLDEGIAALNRAVALDPQFVDAHLNLGLGLGAKGRLDDALDAFRRATTLAPENTKAHGALGQMLLEQGRFVEARETIRHCLELLPEKDPFRKVTQLQLARCEQLLTLDQKLPALLQGTVQPSDSAEQLAVAGLCRLPGKRLYVAAVRYYAAAFSAEPKRAEDLKAGYRYSAAGAAALGGFGQGKDDPGPDEPARAQLRQQALDWLRADLALWGKQLETGQPAARAAVQKTLQRWQNDPDLAGVRDDAALAKLPEAERDAWRKFWAEVAALLERAEGKK